MVQPNWKGKESKTTTSTDFVTSAVQPMAQQHYKTETSKSGSTLRRKTKKKSKKDDDDIMEKGLEKGDKINEEDEDDEKAICFGFSIRDIIILALLFWSIDGLAVTLHKKFSKSDTTVAKKTSPGYADALWNTTAGAMVADIGNWKNPENATGATHGAIFPGPEALAPPKK